MKAGAAPRKGAVRVADIDPALLQALSRGELETVNLVECLALDQVQLLATVFPDLSEKAQQAARQAGALGILKRMAAMGELLLQELGEQGIARCREHGVDTVRGWACFMIAAREGLDLQARLEAMQALADDAHFGVREWAWLALRPHVMDALDEAMVLLARWTASPSPRLRRFACEALRPRGVWCAHIAGLKRDPQKALPILVALRADEAVYVQDSVANWLNDAGKTRPDWVRGLCAQWLQDSPCQATRRIVERALRNLK
ncbi:DNA alkylation repair protein [Comamonas composti]|uniref:DNA alkylation repair protein n=1 Tax=Comamonas composti TaxID=408558 RepID=UPI00041BD8AF|nr:DNA alkylation repair protein [Comamonas composti]